jgi:hypothetical protein
MQLVDGNSNGIRRVTGYHTGVILKSLSYHTYHKLDHIILVVCPGDNGTIEVLLPVMYR